jgi:hypothetical protein
VIWGWHRLMIPQKGSKMKRADNHWGTKDNVERPRERKYTKDIRKMCTKTQDMYLGGTGKNRWDFLTRWSTPGGMSMECDDTISSHFNWFREQEKYVYKCPKNYQKSWCRTKIRSLKLGTQAFSKHQEIK